MCKCLSHEALVPCIWGGGGEGDRHQMAKWWLKQSTYQASLRYQWSSNTLVVTIAKFKAARDNTPIVAAFEYSLIRKWIYVCRTVLSMEFLMSMLRFLVCLPELKIGYDNIYLWTSGKLWLTLVEVNMTSYWIKITYAKLVHIWSRKLYG